MPWFLDRHDLPDVSAEDVANAHARDVEVQGKYGVRYVSYWLDYERQHAFCLVESPDKDSAAAVHREAHGLIADDIIEVDPNRLGEFLGLPPTADLGEAYTASAFRTVLFTDIQGSTALTQRLGDDHAMHVLRTHNEVVRGALQTTGGTEIKHTGDGIMASFSSVASAVRCSIAIQEGIAQQETGDEPLSLKIGLAAGEPVADGDDLFGATVQLAARLCDKAGGGGILVASTVRDLCIGKGFPFSNHVELELRGFDEPVRAYGVQWSTDDVAESSEP
jgi:class 3 adenylate cyclase